MPAGGGKRRLGLLWRRRSTRQYGWVLLIPFCQGLLYLVLLPPWQHYDEPTHFEYAWLIANRGHLPASSDYDIVLRREVAASMVSHQFFWNLPRPDLLTSPEGPAIGFSELSHPPLYYFLVSVPLRFVTYLDVTSQLYVARAVSVLLFVLTIGIIMGVMVDLTAPSHPLRWAVPVAAASIPSVADLMTAVNNDVGAVCIFSLFLWGVARLLRFGCTVRRALWVVSSALVAVFVKDTAALALLLLPLVGVLTAAHQFHWPTGRMIGCLGGFLLATLLVIFQGGDAAYWYRWSAGTNQSLGTRAVAHGRNVVTVEALPNDHTRYLLNPISEHGSLTSCGASGDGRWLDMGGRANNCRSTGISCQQQRYKHSHISDASSNCHYDTNLYCLDNGAHTVGR